MRPFKIGPLVGGVIVCVGNVVRRPRRRLYGNVVRATEFEPSFGPFLRTIYIHILGGCVRPVRKWICLESDNVQVHDAKRQYGRLIRGAS